MNADFEALDTLKAKWDALQPLKPEDDARLWKKLRLEWNYNSNQIEGNTLSYGETELLLIHDRTTGDHPLRDYEEMKAHDVGIAHVQKLAAEQRLLGETDIRDLNKIILKEPYWKEAITPDGRPTRKQVVPGEYKSTPNNVRTATGEIFAFASPAETPIRMRELVDWLRNALEQSTFHPIKVAAKLHHDFVLIHPFDDGNGRVARLLTNYVLLRVGYPPIIVKSADKTAYLTALRKADAGELFALSAYLAVQAEWSLDLAIRAARGRSIEEQSDVEKEVAIFIRDQQGHQDRVKRRSPEVLRDLFDLGWRSLFEKFESKISTLYPLFLDHALAASPAAPGGNSDWRMVFEHRLNQPDAMPFRVDVRLRGFRGQAPAPFNLESDLTLFFDEFGYRVVSSGHEVAKKLYSEPVLSEEAETITANILRALFDRIKAETGSV